MPDATLWQAKTSEQLVGFKAGYAQTRNRYYSWLGAVAPEYRRQGIASQLMASQHEWSIKNGYESIEDRKHNVPFREIAKVRLALL